MAHIAVFVASISPNGSQLDITGEARLSTDGGLVNWTTTASYGASAAVINSAIRNAAISSAETAGYTIGALDKKTIYAGPQDLPL